MTTKSLTLIATLVVVICVSGQPARTAVPIGGACHRARTPSKPGHEKLGTSTQKITVGANETKAIDFVFETQPGK